MTDHTSRDPEPWNNPEQDGAASYSGQRFDPTAYGPPQPQPLLEESDETQAKRRVGAPMAAGLVTGAQVGALQLAPGEAGEAAIDGAAESARTAGAGGAATSTKTGLLATTTAKIVAGCVAAVLVGTGLIAWGALSQLGDGSSEAASDEASASQLREVAPEEPEPVREDAAEPQGKTEFTPEPLDEPEPEPEPAVAPAAPSIEDVNGRWCSTPESTFDQGCYEIALPNVTYPNGNTYELTYPGALDELGGLSMGVPGAPFGIYYPAGTVIGLPDYYPGADMPDQDRIWNSQNGLLLLRG